MHTIKPFKYACPCSGAGFDAEARKLREAQWDRAGTIAHLCQGTHPPGEWQHHSAALCCAVCYPPHVHLQHDQQLSLHARMPGRDFPPCEGMRCNGQRARRLGFGIAGTTLS